MTDDRCLTRDDVAALERLLDLDTRYYVRSAFSHTALDKNKNSYEVKSYQMGRVASACEFGARCFITVDWLDSDTRESQFRAVYWGVSKTPIPQLKQLYPPLPEKPK